MIATPRKTSRSSSRLELLAGMVPVGSRVADIGTGHGILAVELLRSGRATHCIASEKTLQRLDDARTDRAELPAGPDWRHGDGLRVLAPADRIEVAVLAGMGGRTILALLDRAPARLELGRLVLQPQTEVGAVRRGLVERGWTIVDERIATERGRVYFLIAAEPGVVRPRPFAGLSADEVLEVGPCLLGAPDDDLRRYWSRQLSRFERILARPGRGPARDAARDGRDLARRVLAAVEADPPPGG